MVSVLRTQLTQRSFSAIFFEIDKSNKLFCVNIKARKAYYFVISDREKQDFTLISETIAV